MLDVILLTLVVAAAAWICFRFVPPHLNLRGWASCPPETREAAEKTKKDTDAW